MFPVRGFYLSAEKLAHSPSGSAAPIFVVVVVFFFFCFFLLNINKCHSFPSGPDLSLTASLSLTHFLSCHLEWTAMEERMQVLSLMHLLPLEQRT